LGFYLPGITSQGMAKLTVHLIPIGLKTKDLQGKFLKAFITRE